MIVPRIVSDHPDGSPKMHEPFAFVKSLAIGQDLDLENSSEAFVQAF
jgi:hypothetical protein